MNTKQDVLEYLRTIPEGKVTTYKNIWQKFGMHPRAIASIMKHNIQPDVYPCYKVVSASRELSWYSAYEWVSTKVEKLKNDGVIIENNKIATQCIV